MEWSSHKLRSVHIMNIATAVIKEENRIYILFQIRPDIYAAANCMFATPPVLCWLEVWQQRGRWMVSAL